MRIKRVRLMSSVLQLIVFTHYLNSALSLSVAQRLEETIDSQSKSKICFPFIALLFRYFAVNCFLKQHLLSSMSKLIAHRF